MSPQSSSLFNVAGQTFVAVAERRPSDRKPVKRFHSLAMLTLAKLANAA